MRAQRPWWRSADPVGMFWVAATFAVVGICLFWSAARADGPNGPWHHHPPADAAIHEKFYADWMRPDNPGVSCCNLQDCAPVLQIRRVGNRIEAKRESDGQWVVVPEEKIEQKRDSPDGRSHLCSRGPTAFCLVLGSGT